MNSTLKVILRYLGNNKLFTALNTIGLAIGISACWLVFTKVHHELSFDQAIPDAQDVYQIVTEGEFNGEKSGFPGVTLGLAPLLTEEALDDVLVVPIYSQYFERMFVPQQGDEKPKAFDEQEHIVGTQASYFDLLPYEWIVGEASTALLHPHQIVLTESRAQLYFPDERPEDLLGKTILGDTVGYSISGIVRDLPFASSFPAQVFMPIPEKEWNNRNWSGMNSNHLLYVKTKNKASLDHLLAITEKKYQETAAAEHAKLGFSTEFIAFPLLEKHFERQFDTEGLSVEKKVIYGLSAIGLFLLLLACINYINLSTAQVPQRAKEIGIRKTLGANPRMLTGRFLLETFFITFFSLLLSWPLTTVFRKLFPEFAAASQSFSQQAVALVIFLLLLLVVITVLAGIYPAYLINKVHAIDTLKGKLETKIQGTRLTLRKALIVFQFVIAQFFIVAALIIGQQLDYTLHKDLGFEHESIVTLRMPYKSYENADVDPFLYQQALTKHTDIPQVALGHEPQNQNHWGNVYYFTADTGKVQLNAPRKYIDENYLDVYQIELLAGRNIQQTDTMRDILINEAAVKALGLKRPQDAIGQYLEQHDHVFLPIVGVFKDFHQKSLRTAIEPLILGASNSSGQLQTFHIKLPEHRQKWSSVFDVMEREWKALYPNAPFSYQFVDDRIQQLYENEHKTAKFIDLATAITILISCLGLFGLATLTAFQRTKEIGIRKVLGASVSGIVAMLSKDFVKLVLIAMIIASPIAWWAMNTWLEDFAYRIDIQWWMFVLAGLVAVVIALLTVSSQAIRAAVANPVDSLRDE